MELDLLRIILCILFPCHVLKTVKTHLQKCTILSCSIHLPWRESWSELSQRIDLCLNRYWCILTGATDFTRVCFSLLVAAMGLAVSDAEKVAHASVDFQQTTGQRR